jgi:hypothetical protein
MPGQRGRITGRRLVAAGLTAGGLLAVLVGATLAFFPNDAPSRTWAAENLSGDVLAYEVWDRTPHLVFWHGNDAPDSKVYFDHLRRDPVSIDWPPTPRWQWTGNWYSIAATDAPASLGVARCTGIMGETCDKPTELFGQVNAPEIAALEAEYDGAWHHFPVAAPGFAVRLAGFHGVPSSYRWLDAAGGIVWTEGQASPRSAP